jgi:hypothetical protein
VHHAHDVQLEHVAELIGVVLDERRALGAAGIGNQQIDRPARRDRLLHAAVHSFRVGDVGDDVARGLARAPRSASAFRCGRRW